MIQYKSGNILQEDVEALVNTVNCVGVMGRGIALQFKNVFPENFKAYALACKHKEVQPGRMFLFETGQLTNPRYIINFPTKQHWRDKSQLADIQSGLIALVAMIHEYGIRSIAIPPLGSGLGGLNWAEVKKYIETALHPLTDVSVIIYEPNGIGDAKKRTYNHAAPTMTPGRAALIGLIDCYLKGLLDPFITLLEIHKLMYFMQEAGEPLHLRYQKGIYGPYAENLRHVLATVEGHFVSGYTNSDKPNKQIELIPTAIDQAKVYLQQQPDTLARFDRVEQLVAGFESPFGLELLATIHWVIKNESVSTMDEVVSKTYAWNDRKRQFSGRQIALAVKVLSNQGWVQTLS